MRGYTSAYRRMKWDSIATTLTQNLSYPCSDKKLHPEQNRVLSIAEACKIQGIPDSFQWVCLTEENQERPAKFTLIRDSIGESIPPMIVELLAKQALQAARQTTQAISP